LRSDRSIQIIELPKFLVRANRSRDPLERWCYFLRNAENLEADTLPPSLKAPPIEKAVEVLRVMTQSEIERERYEARQKWIRDQKSFINSAREEGRMEELFQSVETILEMRFGEEGTTLFADVRAISDLAKLRAIQLNLLKAKSIDEARSAVQSPK
jgi:predicted transposase/invertase (TIGR01784 family)